MVMVILSALVERFSVSRKQDFNLWVSNSTLNGFTNINVFVLLIIHCNGHI